MDWVPTECLASIFQYLPLADRLTVRSVCRQWHRAVSDWSLLDSFGTFYISSESQWPDFFACKGGPYLFEHIKYLHCDSVSLHYNRYRTQWDTLLPRLHGLTLCSTDISSGDFISLLSGCRRLKSLHLVHLRDLFLSGVVLNKEEDVLMLHRSLGGVKDLNLSLNRYMSDFIFSRLVYCGSVESLDLSGCNILNGAVAPTSVFTFPQIIKIIGNSPQLKVLNLSSTGLDDKGLCDISECVLVLKDLNLSNCSGISGDGLLRLLESQRELESLNLDHCHRWMSISQEDKMVQIATHLARIPRLSLSGLYIPDEWKSYSHNLFKTLSKGNVWKKLNMSGARIPGESLIQPFNTPHSTLTNLKALILSDFSSSFSSRQFLSLFSVCRDLVVLNLSGCANVSNSVVIFISLHLKHLEVLNINRCAQVSDVGLGTLETASYIHSEPLEDPSFFKGVKCDDASIQSLKKLRELHVSSLKLTTSSIHHSFTFQDLVKIDVSFCFSLDDLSFAYLGEQCPSLLSVIAKKCSLSDVGFKALTRRLRVLQEIDVEGNQQLSSLALEDLPINCRYLRVLNISHCYKISQESVDKMRAAYFNLRLLRHMNSSSQQSVNDSYDNDPLIKFKKSKKIKPWKLLCCVSKPR